MKKKLLLIGLMLALFVCIFAINVSAVDIPEWTEVITYETGDNAIAYKDGFDTTSRVLLDNGDGTYSTYPTNYIIKGNDSVFSAKTELDFAALNTASTNNYSYASVIRIEIPVGFTELSQYALRAPSDKGNFSSLLTAKIPEGVTIFNAYILYSDSLVQEIELPSTLTTLGKEFATNNTNLRKVNIPAGITTIPEKAFQGCTALTEVDFSNAINLESISSYAFRSANLSETEVIIHKNCTTIDSYAFKASGIKSIVIPSTVTTLGTEAFSECASLSEVTCKAENIPSYAFSQCTAVTSLTLENTKTIATYAFYKCPIATDIIIPEGCTHIGEMAFRNSATTYVYLPSTLIDTEESPLGVGIFKGSASLKTVVSKSPVIANEMFTECFAIESVDLQNAVTIGTYAFATSGKASALKELKLYEGLVSIGSYAFSRSALTTLTIPSTVTEVADSAFRNSTSLTKVCFLGSTFGTNMFNGCSSLSTLVLTEKITTYGSGALDNISTNFIAFYTGEDHARIKSLINMSRFNHTNYSSYEEYIAGTHKTGNYMFIYNANLCDVAYDSNHNIPEETYIFTSFVESACTKGICTRCAIETDGKTFDPIFSGILYSTKQVTAGDTSRGIVFTYYINEDSLNAYEKYNKALSYGVLAVMQSKITSEETVQNPLNADATTSYKGVIVADVSGRDILSVDLVIRGDEATWQAVATTPLYMLGYVTDGTTLYYLGSSEGSNVSSTSIADVKAVVYNDYNA